MDAFYLSMNLYVERKWYAFPCGPPVLNSILKGKPEHYDYRKGLRMAKKIQKLKPDTVLKNYWRSNERFADFMEKIAGTGRFPFMRCWIFRKK